MKHPWRDDIPIYRQLQARVTELISDGSYLEGEAVPSVRQASIELGINHLTVGKAYQSLVDEGLLEKRRGLGMFVVSGARATLLAREKQRFFDTDIRHLAQKMQRFNVNFDELRQALDAQNTTITPPITQGAKQESTP